MTRAFTRRMGALGLAAGLAVSLAACSSSSPAGETGAGGSDESYDIGVLVFDTTVPFFTPMVAGSEAAAEELGVTLDIQNGQGDLAQEIAIIQQFIAQGKDALVLTVSDGVGVVPALQAAHDAGIPVIANNTVIEDDQVITYNGSDNVRVGNTLAEAVCSAVPADGKIAVIMGVLGSSPQLHRQQGLNEGIAENCPGVEILAEQTANWDNAEALAVGQDYLNRWGAGQIDAIVGQGPETVAPARWASENGRTDVQFIVADIPVAVADAMREGIISLAVWQDPFQHGYQSVVDAVNWLNGKEDLVPRPTHYGENIVVTLDNLDSIQPY